MELILTARSKAQENTDYLPLSFHGLEAFTEVTGGAGSPKEPICVKVRIINRNSGNWAGVIHIEHPFPKGNPRFFLPAFLYGRNRGEAPQRVHCEFPRLREGNPVRPSSPWWMTRGDRLSHPVALAFDSGMVYGLCASPYFIRENGSKKQWKPGAEGEFYQYAGYSCSLAHGTIGYTLGYENAPWMFINAYHVKDRAPLSDNCFELKAGEAVEIALGLYRFGAEAESDINAVIREVYYQFHQGPRKGSDVKTTVADLANAVYRDAWLPDDRCYAGQVFEKENGTGRTFNKLLSISWTNGLSAATPMLMAALRLNDESMRQQALSCIDNIVQNSFNPASGLPYDSCKEGKWCNEGWWFDGLSNPGHSSYLAGQALFYILKAYEYEKRRKRCIHDDWLAFVKNILVRMEQTKNPDGEYPYLFSEKTGNGIEYDAFCGAWCMAALAYYCLLTGDGSYLESLRKSERHYYEAYIRHMECYGSPLDTCKTVDSEGVLAYIKAVRCIHSMTGDPILLEHMRDALCYEFSFKFCYNSPIRIPPLGRIGWSSCGGSVTSVSNPHIHPMSSSIIGELLYFVGNCGDEYVRDRMKDTVDWSCQSYNTFDGEFDYGKKGWMSERFCYSEGLVTQKYPDGSFASTWFCLMPWAIGSILDGLAGDYWDRVS